MAALASKFDQAGACCAAMEAWAWARPWLGLRDGVRTLLRGLGVHLVCPAAVAALEAGDTFRNEYPYSGYDVEHILGCRPVGLAVNAEEVKMSAEMLVCGKGKGAVVNFSVFARRSYK